MRLTSLVPAKLQKVIVADKAGGQRVVVEVFAGRKRFILVNTGSVQVVDDIVAPEARDATLQGLLRKELVPGIVSAVEVHDDTAVTRLRISRPGDSEPSRALVVEGDARDPRWLLLASTGDGDAWRILAAVPGTKPKDGRDTRRGQPYTAPTQPVLIVATPEKPTTRTEPSPRKELDKRLKAESVRLTRLISRITGDLDKHGDPARHRSDGEALKTQLVTITDGAVKQTSVHDMQKRFARAKKAEAARAHAAPRLHDAEARLAAVSELRGRLASFATDDDARRAIDTLLADDKAAMSARRRAAKAGQRRSWRSFVVSDGVVVRVGRSAKDNDVLRKSARGNDMWLHARDTHGSHVIVAAASVSPAVMLDAAHLAAWFSGARGERHVDVQHCHVKDLKSPGAGAPAGLVLVPREQVMHLRVDSERIAGLLANETATR